MKLTHAKTVGELIEVLSQYKFNTPINTTCCECRHGWSGGSVSVEDFTNQTYGYIDLHINQSGYKSNMTRDDKIFKIFQMSYLLGRDIPSTYGLDDHVLHETYKALWIDMYARSTRI